ncbi:MAG: DUF4197 domain-containing protein [Flavobacteriales bacterium]|nr:DUF4197 domain-containing protein [Flavobacteriales bacterium]
MRTIASVFLLMMAAGCTTTSPTTGPRSGLRSTEVAEGLVEALLVGADKSTASASKVDGFWGNVAIRILMPPEAEKVKEVALKVGLRPAVERFELSLNRAAEDAAKEAKPILVKAIRSIRFRDVWQILTGGPHAATDYLRNQTETQLLGAFRPVVQGSIGRAEVTKYWQPLAQKYNSLPLVRPVNPDLTTYVTQHTVNGLFTLIAEEERLIRENPIARISELLKKVFGNKG